MKKIFVVLLVSLVAVAAFGERGGTSIGATYIVSSQQYTTGLGASQNLVLSGVGLNDNLLSSAPFGFALDITLAYLLAGSIDGGAVDMSLYPMRIMFDFLVGVGYQLPIARNMFLTFTLGPHFNIALLAGSSASVNNAMVAGIGSTVKLQYLLTPTFGFYVGVKGTYDFFAVKNGYGTTFNNGLILAGAGGVTLAIY